MPAPTGGSIAGTSVPRGLAGGIAQFQLKDAHRHCTGIPVHLPGGQLQPRSPGLCLRGGVEGEARPTDDIGNGHGQGPAGLGRCPCGKDGNKDGREGDTHD